MFIEPPRLVRGDQTSERESRPKDAPVYAIKSVLMPAPAHAYSTNSFQERRSHNWTPCRFLVVGHRPMIVIIRDVPIFPWWSYDDDRLTVRACLDSVRPTDELLSE